MKLQPLSLFTSLFLCIFMQSTFAQASYCTHLLGNSRPDLSGRMVSALFVEVLRDPGGILGGTHFFNTTARDINDGQVGARFLNKKIEQVFDDMETNPFVSFHDRMVGGQLKKEKGEWIVVIDRIWQRDPILAAETEAGRVLTFPSSLED